MNDRWTPELLAELARTTPREFEALHPGEFTDGAVHIARSRLRKKGVEVKDSPIGRPADPVVVNMPELPPAPTEEELWAAYDAMYVVQKKHSEHKALRYANIGIETERPFGIVFISDMHLGNKGVDTVQLREDIELIQTCDKLKVYMGGDWADNFVISALSSVHRDESLVTIEIQFELLKSILRQLGDSLLAIGMGNHDAWHKKVSGIDPSLAFLNEVPALYTGEDCYLNLTVGQQEYVIYRKHRPNRTTQFNEGHGIQHAWRFGEKAFDVGVMEHHHVPHLSTFIGHRKMCWAIRTGSYKVEDGFALEHGLPNSRIGTPVLVLYPFRREIVPFMSIPAAIEFLEAA